MIAVHELLALCRVLPLEWLLNLWTIIIFIILEGRSPRNLAYGICSAGLSMSNKWSLKHNIVPVYLISKVPSFFHQWDKRWLAYKYILFMIWVSFKYCRQSFRIDRLHRCARTSGWYRRQRTCWIRWIHWSHRCNRCNRCHRCHRYKDLSHGNLHSWHSR